MAKKLTPRSEDYSKWYNEIVVDADLAQHSDVKGCMVIKPYGYAIWERMKEFNKGKAPPEFMSTHPSAENRIKKINEWTNKILIEYPPINLS